MKRGRPIEGPQTKEDQEREANLFARCLLIPDDLLRREVAKFGGFDIGDDRHLDQLAKKFAVSHTLMAIRIVEVFGI